MDSTPPSYSAAAAVESDWAPHYGLAPGDIYPRGGREAELCASASSTDWAYLAVLVALDAGAIWAGSSYAIKYSDSVPIRITGPAMIGLTWGATVGGAWLSLPKCSPHWVGETPREGAVRETWPLALSFALLAGATAPIVNAIANGSNQPAAWSTFEREMHLVTAGVLGFGGAFLPYLIPPRTWASARELDRLRFGVSGDSAFVGYSGSF